MRVLRALCLVVGGAALLAALLAASAPAAQAALTAKLRSPARGRVAERAWNAVVEVRQDGKPFRGRVALVARDTSGAVRVFRARPARAGLFRARIVFPWSARWTVSARALGRSIVVARANVGTKPRGPDAVTIAQAAEMVALADGTLLVVEDGLSRVVRLDPATGQVTPWQEFDDTYGIDFAPDGSTYVTSNQAIIRVDSAGRRTEITRLPVQIGPLAVDAAGFVYVATAGQQIVRINPATRATSVYAGNGTAGATGDGGPATAAQIQGVHGIAFGRDGALYLADTGNDRVRRIDVAGRITTVATFRIPVGAATAPDGSIYVTSGANRVHRIAPSGEVTVIAGTGRAASTGDGGPAIAASVHGPAGITVDANGSVYVAEFESGHIRRIDASGTITTILRR